jgi:hypothetical protein
MSLIKTKRIIANASNVRELWMRDTRKKTVLIPVTGYHLIQCILLVQMFPLEKFEVVIDRNYFPDGFCERLGSLLGVKTYSISKRPRKTLLQIKSSAKQLINQLLPSKYDAVIYFTPGCPDINIFCAEARALGCSLYMLEDGALPFFGIEFSQQWSKRLFGSNSLKYYMKEFYAPGLHWDPSILSGLIVLNRDIECVSCPCEIYTLDATRHNLKNALEGACDLYSPILPEISESYEIVYLFGNLDKGEEDYWNIAMLCSKFGFRRVLQKARTKFVKENGLLASFSDTYLYDLPAVSIFIPWEVLFFKYSFAFKSSKIICPYPSTVFLNRFGLDYTGINLIVSNQRTLDFHDYIGFKELNADSKYAEYENLSGY